MNKTIPSEDLIDTIQRLSSLQDKLRGKQIFLSGGTGFFGKWLLKSFVLFNRQYGLDATLTVLSRNSEKFLSEYPEFCGFKEIIFIDGDIRSFSLPTVYFDYVIHAATEASAKLDREQPEEMTSVIVDGTQRILQMNFDKMLFVSSGAIYGIQPSELECIPEDYIGQPVTAYGRGKLLAEQLCIESGQPVAIARCFAFVGPWLPLDAHFAVGNFILDCLAGKHIIIKEDGTPFRSYMYAADLAVWLWTILVNGQNGRAYNVGSEQAISIADLATEVNSCCGGENEISTMQQAQSGVLPMRYVPDTGRAQKELNLSMNYSIREALQKTIQWHKSR
ncbi:MAG: NAD(P)-dependent oxidoreductase [Victivallaceae bacterium]